MKKLFGIKKSYKKEFKRQIRFAIIAAVGFTIAFAWRNAIYNSTSTLISKITDTAEVILTEVYTALFITFVGVLFLLLSSKILKEK